MESAQILADLESQSPRPHESDSISVGLLDNGPGNSRDSGADPSGDEGSVLGSSSQTLFHSIAENGSEAIPGIHSNPPPFPPPDGHAIEHGQEVPLGTESARDKRERAQADFGKAVPMHGTLRTATSGRLSSGHASSGRKQGGRTSTSRAPGGRGLNSTASSRRDRLMGMLNHLHKNDRKHT